METTFYYGDGTILEVSDTKNEKAAKARARDLEAEAIRRKEEDRDRCWMTGGPMGTYYYKTSAKALDRWLEACDGARERRLHDS